jgi:murein DD-endopeptidase MepM/ murein hydrolase activator NlpD|nr:peptidase [Aeromicrobium sp.]
MIGMVALMAAGVGTFASAGANGADGDLTSLGYEPAGSPRTTGAQARAVDAEVDVSRDFDRPKLERRTAVLATQRAQTLRQVDRDITATAQVREREEKVRAQQEEKRRKQWVLPVAGYTLTARFGQQSSMWSSGAHTGLDFAGPSGTEIVSVAAGTVTSAGYEGSYGNRTVITLPDGTKISYCHQSSFDVEAGDQVQPGQPIGYTGATGNVTGPHLHLEVEPPGSGPADPVPVLREHGISP